ncbi:MAG: Nucleotidyltransferase substrate binding protein, HI0074 family [uncultured bacterium]|nr:MAG: Nucleotidyltransferase substrate binding protein, HI0074 family [uncultured bacterium]
MTKGQSLNEELLRALDRLNEALALPSENVINQDASIQRFEFTFELSWKLMQEVLIENRVDTSRGVKTIIRDSSNLGLIDNPEEWLKFLEDRNITAHTYKEEETRKIYEDLKDFPPLVGSLLDKIKDF